MYNLRIETGLSTVCANGKELSKNPLVLSSVWIDQFTEGAWDELDHNFKMAARPSEKYGTRKQIFY